MYYIDRYKQSIRAKWPKDRSLSLLALPREYGLRFGIVEHVKRDLPHSIELTIKTYPEWANNLRHEFAWMRENGRESEGRYLQEADMAEALVINFALPFRHRVWYAERAWNAPEKYWLFTTSHQIEPVACGGPTTYEVIPFLEPSWRSKDERATCGDSGMDCCPSLR